MAINKAKIRQLAERVVEEANQFNMGMWFYPQGESPNVGACGTTACLAGHVCLMDGKLAVDAGNAIDPLTGDIFSAEVYAKQALGLTTNQANRLFHATRWPAEFMHRYYRAMRAKNYQEAACVAADRLKFFCDTEGTDGAK